MECIIKTVCLFAVQQNNYYVSFVYCSKKDSKRWCLENLVFCTRYFSKTKSNPAKKSSEQCFLGKTKPTCQNSALSEHFQNWPKNQGDVLACRLSIFLCIFIRSSRVFMRKALFNNWFMLKHALSSYGARRKYGEHERSVRVAWGNSQGQL